LQFTKPQLQQYAGDLSHIRRASRWTLGTTRSRFLVHEPSTGGYGYYSKELQLEFPKEFKLSNLILSRQVVKAAPEAKSDPLVTGEAKVLPSVSRQFRNGRPLDILL